MAEDNPEAKKEKPMTFARMYKFSLKVKLLLSVIRVLTLQV